MKTEQTNQHGGEAALVEQIASLQKQLDNCMETRPQPQKGIIKRTEAMEKTLAMACAAPFMPKRFTKEDGRWAFPPKFYQWRGLQSTLLEWEGLSQYWPTELFRKALGTVNYISSNMQIQEISNLKAEEYDQKAKAIGWSLCTPNEEDYAALFLLKEMLEKIKAAEEMPGAHVDELLFSVSLVLQCQAIYLSLQEPEEEERNESSWIEG